jgi:hypothetical protein
VSTVGIGATIPLAVMVANPTLASAHVVNPTITAKVTSELARTSYGWYRSPVTVTFTCTAGSAPVSDYCPAPVRLSHDTSGATVKARITAGDGGTASITVGPIKIDHTKPIVQISDVTPGKSYRHPPKVKIRPFDALSGMASCKLRVHKHRHTITLKAVARDKAGNRSTARLSYRLKR